MTKVSVVMTVFNGEKFIGEAIESILNQTFTDFEFIIVDNASTDKTKEIITSYKDPRIILIENKDNLGQTRALNIGIRHSRGQFIARMDADDISLPERLELQYKYMEQNHSIAVVGSWHEEIDEQGRHLKYFKMPVTPLEIRYYLISPGELGYYCVSHPTALIRRNVLFEVGSYNERCLAQDYDLWLRIIRKYRIANLDKFLVKHRVIFTQQTKELKNQLDADCEKIIITNIHYYLPSLEENELMSLTRMLQYKPQISKRGGTEVLGNFKRFFEYYRDGDEDSISSNKIQIKMILFYLLRLVKTNPAYSLRELVRMFYKNPEMLLEGKLYRKIIKTIFYH